MTYRKFPSHGVDGAPRLLDVGLGLTLALQATMFRQSDFSTVYAAVASLSRLFALAGAHLALVGIFLVARFRWVERGVEHNRLVTSHRKLGPWSLYLISFHFLFIVFSSAGQDGVMLAVEMCRLLNRMASM